MSVNNPGKSAVWLTCFMLTSSAVATVAMLLPRVISHVVNKWGRP